MKDKYKDRIKPYRYYSENQLNKFSPLRKEINELNPDGWCSRWDKAVKKIRDYIELEREKE